MNFRNINRSKSRIYNSPKLNNDSNILVIEPKLTKKTSLVNKT